MAAVLAALVLAIFAAGGSWLGIGSRLRLDPDERTNDLLNLGAYLGIAFVPCLILVFAFSGF